MSGAEARRNLLDEHRVELLLFALSLVAYALSSFGMLLHQSAAPHFVLKAEAFLHGQFHGPARDRRDAHAAHVRRRGRAGHVLTKVQAHA